MSEQTAAFRKVFEYELLGAETAVKHYRSLLGLPPVGSSTDCAKEIESLKSQLQEKTKELDSLKRCTAQQKSENEVLHRKVHDLGHKLSQAHRECSKLRNELKETKEEFSAYLNKNIKSATIFKNPEGFWSGEGEPKEGELVFKNVDGVVRIIPFNKKAELYDELLENASDCLVGGVLGIKHEPNDLEPDKMFYFLRITEDEAYRIDMGGYAHLEVWED